MYNCYLCYRCDLFSNSISMLCLLFKLLYVVYQCRFAVSFLYTTPYWLCHGCFCFYILSIYCYQPICYICNRYCSRYLFYVYLYQYFCYLCCMFYGCYISLPPLLHSYIFLIFAISVVIPPSLLAVLNNCLFVIFAVPVAISHSLLLSITVYLLSLLFLLCVHLLLSPSSPSGNVHW